jgi:hypothetical protein
MALFASNLAPASTDRALGSAVIQRSLRFNRDDAAHLTYTPASASTDRTKITISAWVKKCGIEQEQNIFHAGTSSDGRATLRYYHSGGLDCLSFFARVSGSFILQVDSSAKFRDTNAWYHVVARCDTTNGTANIYVNGEDQTLATSTKPSGSQNLPWFNNIEHQIGERGYDGSGTYMNGYMAEINVIQGQALDPSYFGFTDPVTGIWMPKRYEGTYGDGFYLDFSDNTSTTTLGIDKSPNGNDFTLNNFNVHDSVKDTPTNAFCTMNLLDKSAGAQLTTTNGNLRVYTSHGFRTMRGTFGVSSGKWYWEARLISWASSFIGVTGGDEDITSTSRGAETSNSATIRQNTGNLRTNGSDASYGNSQANGDVLGFALDMDNGKFYISENGTFYNSGDPANGTNAGKTGLTGTVFPSASPYDGKSCYFNFGQDDTFDGNETSQGNTDGNGQGKFKYAPPTGFLSLCTANLPTATSILRPQRHFETLLYTATGNAMSVTGLEFKPDFIWQKARTGSSSHYHYWFDSVRGGRYGLQSNTNGAEFDSGSNTNIVFKHGGFDMVASTGGQGNASSASYVAWCWKAGGAAVSNANGNITSSVSVNEEAGFSIVSYTGNGSNGQTVGHGLTQAPQWIILKARDATQNWRVWHHSLASDGSKRLLLDATNASEDASFLNDTAPTSTVFTLGNADDAWNANDDKYIAYCWHEVPGFSKFGSYTGNGSADGPYIDMGFRPAWVMIKRTSGTDSWLIMDNKRDIDNPVGNTLAANSSGAENVDTGGIPTDFLSNGFKCRGSGGDFNGDGETYVYMAFAEQPGVTPFDTSPNAR